MKYIIVGNGVAGVEAALAIRKSDSEGEITIISESKNLFYYRPRLIEYLADEISVDKFTLYKEDHYEKNRIQNVLNTRIVRIDIHKKSVVSEDGREFSYDRLLLATGALPFMPGVKGADLRGVFSLRGVTDADSIKEYCRDLTEVTVVGGGLLGLENAFSLSRLGKRVTVVEFRSWLLPRQLDEEGGRLLQRMLEAKGLSFVLDDSVEILRGQDSVQSVLLKSGREIKTDAVIFSSGIECRGELARQAGLEVNRGILVDDHLRTSVPDIYAAGDPAEHKGCLYGIWPAARDQGRIAGLNMAGIPTPYKGTVLSNVLKITGIDLYSAGDFNASGAEVYSSISDSSYKKLLLAEGKVVGIIVLGDADAVKTGQRVMERGGNPEDFKKLLQS